MLGQQCPSVLAVVVVAVLLLGAFPTGLVSSVSASCVSQNVPSTCYLNFDCLTLVCPSYQLLSYSPLSITLTFDICPLTGTPITQLSFSSPQAVAVAFNITDEALPQFTLIPGYYPSNDFLFAYSFINLDVAPTSTSLYVTLSFCLSANQNPPPFSLLDCSQTFDVVSQATLQSLICPAPITTQSPSTTTTSSSSSSPSSCDPQPLPSSSPYLALHASLAVAGVVLCFFGYRFFRLSLFLAGLNISLVACYLAIPPYISLSSSTERDWVGLGVGVAAGVLLGAFLCRVIHAGYWFMGVVSGALLFCLAILLSQENRFLLSHASLFYALFAILCIVMGGLALIFQKVLLILSTCLCGTSAIVAVLDALGNGGRGEHAVAQAFAGNAEDLPVCWFTATIFAAWPLFLLMGGGIQWLVTGRYWDHKTGRIVMERNTSAPSRSERQRLLLNDLDDEDDELLGEGEVWLPGDPRISIPPSSRPGPPATPPLPRRPLSPSSTLPYRPPPSSHTSTSSHLPPSSSSLPPPSSSSSSSFPPPTRNPFADASLNESNSNVNTTNVSSRNVPDPFSLSPALLPSSSSLSPHTTTTTTTTSTFPPPSSSSHLPPSSSSSLSPFNPFDPYPSLPQPLPAFSSTSSYSSSSLPPSSSHPPVPSFPPPSETAREGGERRGPSATTYSVVAPADSNAWNENEDYGSFAAGESMA